MSDAALQYFLDAVDYFDVESDRVAKIIEKWMIPPQKDVVLPHRTSYWLVLALQEGSDE